MPEQTVRGSQKCTNNSQIIVTRDPILITIGRIGVMVEWPTADSKVAGSSPVWALDFFQCTIDSMKARAYIEMGEKGSMTKVVWR